MNSNDAHKSKRVVPRTTRLAEFYFVTGVLNAIFSPWLVGAFPSFYWVYYCMKNFFLMIWQLLRRKKEGGGKHYWQFEFCYVVNYWACVYFTVCYFSSVFSILAPINGVLKRWGYVMFRIFFAWSNGPLALSVVQQKNGFVFHSLDHMTILAVHIGPPVVSYTMRWFDSALNEAFPNTFHWDVNRSDSQAELLRSLFFIPCVGYFLCWTIPYIFTMYTLRGHMKTRGYESMVESMEHDRNGSPTFLKPFLHLLGPKFNTVMYCVFHGVLCCSSFLFSQLFWRSFPVHTVYLVLLLVVAACNSATFYFEKLIPMDTTDKLVVHDTIEAKLPAEQTETGDSHPGPTSDTGDDKSM